MRAPLASLAAAFLGGIAAGDDVELIPRGEELLAALNCTACHTASAETVARLQPHGAPTLDAVGARVSPAWLRAFLADPSEAKPGIAMPDLLETLPPREREQALDALVHFLVARGGPFEAAPVGVSHPQELEAGRRLLHEVGCAVCHEPEDARHLEVPWYELGDWEWPEPAEEERWVEPGVLAPLSIPLGDLAAKYSVDSLAAFLRDPVAARPSGRMPSLSLEEAEARAIALYLLRDQAFGPGREPAPERGLAYAYYEGDARGPMPDFDALELVRQASWDRMDELPEHRPDRFAFRFTGWVEVPTGGEWTFATTSDDGSRLWIGGELVVDNQNDHAMQEREGSLELPAGRYALQVEMYENLGGEGLVVSWEGPGVARQPIPAEALSHQAFVYRPLAHEELRVDPRKVERGAEWFESLGCARCHEPDAAQLFGVTPLAELDAGAVRSCLRQHGQARVPRYDLPPEDAAAIAAALAAPDELAMPLGDEERLRRGMASLSCFACHRRDGVGGPHPDRFDYFVTYDDVELGDQGRFPPHLEEPGAKLRPEWMRRMATEGASLRPYMATRMPQFGAEAVGPLLDLFERLDPRPDALPEPEFDIAEVENGRKLTGTKGMGCIQCHTFSGYDSLGVPAIDVASVHDTVQYDWFRRLLLDPASVDMNTRMPNFWGEGAAPLMDVHGGDPARQIEALWIYLSLGASMPLPEGLIVPDSAFELSITDRARIVGVFMRDLSPRTVCVGMPEGVHYAFDVQNSRLAKVWRGRFFNARRTWEGRAGGLELPPVDDAIDLPPGVPIGPLLGAWPGEGGAPLEYRVLGRRIDASGRPSWRYEWSGVEVTESVEPFLRAGGAGLRRRFELRAGEDPGEVAFRIGVGDGIATLADGHHRLPSGLELRATEFERHSVLSSEIALDGGAPVPESEVLSVLLPFRFHPAEDGGLVATLEVEYTW